MRQTVYKCASRRASPWAPATAHPESPRHEQPHPEQVGPQSEREHDRLPPERLHLDQVGVQPERRHGRVEKAGGERGECPLQRWRDAPDRVDSGDADKAEELIALSFEYEDASFSINFVPSKIAFFVDVRAATSPSSVTSFCLMMRRDARSWALVTAPSSVTGRL